MFLHWNLNEWLLVMEETRNEFWSARWEELVWHGSCFALFHLAILATSTRHRAYIFRHRLNDKQELPQCFTTALLMWKCVDIVLCSEDFLRSVSFPFNFCSLFPKPLCQDKRCTLCDRPSCLINSADSPISNPDNKTLALPSVSQPTS